LERDRVSQRGALVYSNLSLVPWHRRKQLRHAAETRDACEDQPAANKC
jgi:hypothetical protein